MPPKSTTPESQAAGASSDASSANEAASPAESSEAQSAPAGGEATEQSAMAFEFRLDPQGPLLFNGLELFAKGAREEVAKRIGPHTREKTHRNGDTSLYYDEHGFVLWIKDGIIQGVGVNFKWDGDEMFPETSFKGSIVMGELKVDATTKKAPIEALEAYSVVCHGPAMCAGKSETTKLLMGFGEDAIGQVALFSSSEK